MTNHKANHKANHNVGDSIRCDDDTTLHVVAVNPDNSLVVRSYSSKECDKMRELIRTRAQAATFGNNRDESATTATAKWISSHVFHSTKSQENSND